MAGTGTPLGQMVIELNLDTTKLGDSLTRTQNQLRNFEKQVKSYKSLADYYKTGAEASKALQKQKESLTQAIKLQKKSLDDLNAKYQAQVKDTGEWSRQAQSLAGKIEDGNAKLATYAIRLREIAKESYLASSKLNTFGDQMLKISKGAGVMEKGFDTISQRTRGLSMAVAGGLAIAAKSAMDYETAFIGVQKTVEETATTSYEKLSQNIRAMAKEIPSSAAEIANVAEIAGQLGISADDIVDFTRVVIDMGQATNLSAEEAAVSLAKFQNIVQMSPENIGRLGSTIVHLGNNMATTERDITNMGLRLAATGNLVGLNEHQIMALSAALSAVGMEAEAGGSAVSRIMQKINTAVAEGGEDLTNYASIADMSASKFAEVWRTKPTEAITEFLKGMGRIKEAGGDVTQSLKDLGINSVREIDSLQRLAGAGDLLADALNLANEGWEKGNKLSIEAEKRYSSTESKLKVLRNQLTDIAITVGGPLLDAFSAIVDQARPTIESIGNLAQEFANLDKDTQKFYINLALGIAAISPVSKIIGSTFGTVKDLTNGIGNLSKFLANLGAEKAGALAVQELGTNAATAASSVSVLGNPITWGVLATGVVLAGITILAAEIGKAYQRTKEWGTEVDKVQAQELQNFKNKVDDATEAMIRFGNDAKHDIGEVKQAFEELAREVGRLADDQLSKDLDLADKLGLGEEVKNALIKNAEETKSYAINVSNDVLDIYKRASDQKRKLTDEENAYVLQKQSALIDEQLRLMEFSNEERIAIQKAMNGEFEELNRQQLEKALYTTSDWMKEEKARYEGRNKELLDLLSRTGAEEVDARMKIRDEIEKNELAHHANMEAYTAKHLQAVRAMFEKDKSLTKGSKEELENLKNLYKPIIEELGLTWEEFIQKTNQGTQSAIGQLDLLAKTTKGMSEEAKQAGENWKNLILDKKTGEVKTNLSEVLKETAQTEAGWNNLEFILKHANINTNAKEMILEAMVGTETWNALTVQEKKLLLSANEAMLEIFRSEELLKQWNALTVQEKALLAKDLTSGATTSAQQAIDSVKQKAPSPINAVDNTQGEVAKANAGINSVRQDAPAPIQADDQASGVAAAVKASIDAIPYEKVTVLRIVEASERNPYGPAATRFTGTNYHEGGLALVNDQIGSKYRELITLPTGESFIPKERNVLLNLPRGSKVLRASSTERLMENLGVTNYAKGIGFPEDAQLFKGIEKAQSSLSASSTVVSLDNQGVVTVLKQILGLLEEQGRSKAEQDVYLDLEKVGRIIQERQESNNWLMGAMEGMIR